MRLYGISYMGSKNTIAEEIINFLPNGKRFVDLFGGGFAMSHCAYLSGKYEQVYYNEINPLVVDLIRKAINGDYNYSKFKPEFITREKFFELKDKDGYVKYIWSFGNKGDAYIFGKDSEETKKILHNAVVFNDIDSKIYDLLPDFNIKSSDIVQRRKSVCQQLKRAKNRCDLQRLERLELNCGSYIDYEYKKGDVVYCDIPYENTEKYCKEGFNHKEFYDWAATRPFTVYFSSYEISDSRFFVVWEKVKLTTLSSTSNNTKNIERIYCNRNIKTTLF